MPLGAVPRRRSGRRRPASQETCRRGSLLPRPRDWPGHGSSVRAAWKAASRPSRPRALSTGARQMEEQDQINARHNEKARKRQAFMQAKIAEKTDEKGLLIVHTGKGKGKSTAAFGLACRALGHGMKVGIVQFIKGGWATGEKAVYAAFPGQVDHRVMGEGFTWDTQDRARDIAWAEAGWAEVQRMIADPSYAMVIADELNIVLRYKYLAVEDVVAGLMDRDPMKHVVVTGRNAPDALIEAADLVTDMVQVKHHFHAGIKAQRGIEF
uniref:Corrinoid adenosyltransferase n=2 Tax=cellular organisms TaxID=131567 RepID=M4C635_HYAAE